MNSGKIVAYFPDAGAVTDKDLGLYMLGLAHQDEAHLKEVLHE